MKQENKNIVIELFEELEKRDVNVHEVIYVLREAFVRMNEREDFEDYSEEEIKSIIDLLSDFRKRVESIQLKYLLK